MPKIGGGLRPLINLACQENYYNTNTVEYEVSMRVSTRCRVVPIVSSARTIAVYYIMLK